MYMKLFLELILLNIYLYSFKNGQYNDILTKYISTFLTTLLTQNKLSKETEKAAKSTKHES